MNEKLNGDEKKETEKEINKEKKGCQRKVEKHRGKKRNYRSEKKPKWCKRKEKEALQEDRKND